MTHDGRKAREESHNGKVMGCRGNQEIRGGRAGDDQRKCEEVRREGIIVEKTKVLRKSLRNKGTRGEREKPSAETNVYRLHDQTEEQLIH